MRIMKVPRIPENMDWDSPSLWNYIMCRTRHNGWTGLITTVQTVIFYARRDD